MAGLFMRGEKLIKYCVIMGFVLKLITAKDGDFL